MTRFPLLTLGALLGALLLASPAQAAFQFQTAWGTSGAGSGQFSNPGLIATGPDGTVFVADTGNSRIQHFTADGAFLNAWGSGGAAAGQFNAPNAVAVGPDGTVYVSDTGNNRVQRFQADGTFVSQWGTAGALDGQFNAPTGIAAGPDGSVYVGDGGNARVERFLADGTFLSSFTSGAGGFGQIRGVAAGTDGTVYVVDSGNSRVEAFDAGGTFISTWGSNGAGDGQFSSPQGVAAAATGVYVADNGNNRMQKFTTTGSFVESLTPANSGDTSLTSPFGVAVSPTAAIYVAQNTTARISRYAETGAGPGGGPGGGGTLPPPETGTTANADPVSGTVRVRRPGSNQFELLSAADQIPIGSIVDVTKGTVALTTTAGDKATQTANFFDGVFQLLQPKAKKPVTELRLYGSNFRRSCPRAGRAVAQDSATRRKKVVRQLWGSGKGKFRTRGRYSSATVRGTEWLTQDRCDGTLVRVKEGSVTVRDFAKRKNVIVRAGRSYLAQPKSPRRRRR